MAQRAERAMSEDRQDVRHDFPEALRLVAQGRVRVEGRAVRILPEV